MGVIEDSMSVEPDAKRTDDESVHRSELRTQISKLTTAEALSSSAFLLSDGAAAEDAAQAVVQFAVAKPTWSAEEPESLTRFTLNALEDGTEGSWFQNDRFAKKTVHNACNVVLEVVYPATKKDISKRRKEKLERVVETLDLYSAVTMPRLVVPAVERDQWVVNIIEGRKEQEHVIPQLSCAQVIVVKDYKWQDESNTDNLYFLALFRDLAVRSLRDLRSCHVAALRRVQSDVLPGVAAKFNVQPSQLIAYVHYHPTFWYFHIHIVNCKHAIFDSESSNTALHALDRYHRLDTIVALLEANGEYFATVALPVLLNASTAAWYEIPVPSK